MLVFLFEFITSRIESHDAHEKQIRRTFEKSTVLTMRLCSNVCLQSPVSVSHTLLRYGQRVNSSIAEGVMSYAV